MFSWGNITEKLRVAQFDCSSEVVVDLFAGIGYFTLPYLVHARASKVIACEWNPASVEALTKNLELNNVDLSRCEILQGDNRETCPVDCADRVNLGLIPTSEASWPQAVNALRKETGGFLHIHANVDCAAKQSTTRPREWSEWAEYAREKIKDLLNARSDAARAGASASGSGSSVEEWTVSVEHLEHVKSYGPRVDHVVLDLECRPSSASIK